MTIFILNLVLALAWGALTRSMTPLNILFGFVVGYLALWIASPLYHSRAYFTKIHAVLALALFFLRELILSSVQVAWDVLTPRLRAQPGIIAVPLDLEDEGAVALLSALVSLTPGTLSLDVSMDERKLYVHAMFAGDEAAVCRSIKEGMERRVKAVFAE